ncbi:MAG: hypothetical protein N3I35_07640 [Clostridia bacterium]|nr:hypothetical protein [Clostridia bacterium]
MDRRSLALISSIALIIAGIVLGVFGIVQINKNLILSLIVLFFAVFSTVLGLNLLVLKYIMKK